MNRESGAAEERKPRLAAHVRLSFDARRSQWTLQAPERMLVLDEIAAEIVQRCSGHSSIDAIVDDLVQEFDAPAEDIRRDVIRLIEDLVARGVVVT